MWQLVDSLSRPTLQQYLLTRAADYRRIAGESIAAGDPSGTGPADPGRRLRLLAACGGAAACWRVLGPTLPKPLRRRVARNRRALDRLLRPWRLPGLVTRNVSLIRAIAALRQETRGARARRALTRLGARFPVQAPADSTRASHRRPERLAARLQGLLDEQAGWHDACAGHRVDDAALRACMARVYRKARRAARRDPTAARTRHRLVHLIGVLELIEPGPGPIADGSAPPDVAGIAFGARQLLGTLRELHDLDALAVESGAADAPLVRAGLRRADRRRLARLAGRRRKRLLARRNAQLPVVFGAGPAEFEGHLPWAVFAGLAASGYGDR